MRKTFSILARFQSLPLTLVQGGDSVSVIKLAQRYTLAAYDAAYVALATGRNMQLATIDKKLSAAAFAENASLV